MGTFAAVAALEDLIPRSFSSDLGCYGILAHLHCQALHGFCCARRFFHLAERRLDSLFLAGYRPQGGAPE